jgi:hypothetical protein
VKVDRSSPKTSPVKVKRGEQPTLDICYVYYIYSTEDIEHPLTNDSQRNHWTR